MTQRILFIMLIVGSSISAQVTYTVPGTHATIQAAINAAATGDTIQVGAGTYLERIDFLGKGLVIVGAGIGQSILDGQNLGTVVTIKGGEPLGTRLEGFTIRNGVATPIVIAPSSFPIPFGGGIAVVGYAATPQPLPNLHVRSCRIENCNTTTTTVGNGGGMAVELADQILIDGCEFDFNSSFGGAGGGLYANIVAFIHITGSRFVGNSGSGGGGISLGNSSLLRMTHCDLIGNQAYYSGAGLQLHDTLIPNSHLIRSCRFLANSFLPLSSSGVPQGAGAGIWISGTTTRVESCVIAGNSGAYMGGGIHLNGYTQLGGPNAWEIKSSTIAYNEASNGGSGIFGFTGLKATNCIIRDNFGADDISQNNPYNNLIQVILRNCNVDLSRVVTNPAALTNFVNLIDQDPKYVDPLTGDFHLRLDSPCIDAGDSSPLLLPPVDLDGEPRSIFAAPDIGADEASDIALHPAAAGRVGLGVGGPYDILQVNGSSGGIDRRVIGAVGQAAVVSILQAPNFTGPKNFAIFGLLDLPRLSFVTTVPLGIGEMTFAPCPLLPSYFPYLFTFTNNFGVDLCGELLPSSLSPWTSAPGPLIPFPLNISLQGVIEESPGVYVPTNMVIYQVQ